MEIHKDDRVKMPTKPEWGLGQVIQEPASGKVAILFREVGRKTLSLKHAKLINVEGDEASDPWLDHLDSATLGQDTRYLGPREAVAAFLEKFPDVSGRLVIRRTASSAARLLLERLSSTVNSWPAFRSSTQVWLPMYPAPPVISNRLILVCGSLRLGVTVELKFLQQVVQGGAGDAEQAGCLGEVRLAMRQRSDHGVPLGGFACVLEIERQRGLRWSRGRQFQIRRVNLCVLAHDAGPFDAILEFTNVTAPVPGLDGTAGIGAERH